jgi:hypothetical protein
MVVLEIFKSSLVVGEAMKTSGLLLMLLLQLGGCESDENIMVVAEVMTNSFVVVEVMKNILVIVEVLKKS